MTSTFYKTILGSMAKLIEPDTTANRARIGALLDRFPTVGVFVASRVIADPRCAHVPFVTWPTVETFRGTVRLSWCNAVATFWTGTVDGKLVAVLAHLDVDPFDVDPAGRIMACC